MYILHWQSGGDERERPHLCFYPKVGEIRGGAFGD